MRLIEEEESLVEDGNPSALARLRSAMQASIVSTRSFLDGTIVYVLSKQWADLLSTHIFHLHAAPFCGTAASRPCDK